MRLKLKLGTDAKGNVISHSSVMNKLIAVGEVGTAFVTGKMESLNIGEFNSVCAKVRLTDAQFASYKAGKNSGALWVDSASWLSGRDGKFFIGTLEQALEKKLVKKAIVHVKKGDKIEKLSAFVRAGWNENQKWDHAIAVEKGGCNGRIESRLINDKRNQLYLRKIEKIEVK